MLKIRRYFITGLLLLLPIFISFYILFVVFRFVDGIFGGLINSYLKANFGFFIPGIGFILGGAIVLFSGFLATHFLGKKALPALEQWFLKLPGIRQIYPSTKQIISFLFSKDRASFKKVALVEYPSKGLWSVGFITNDSFEEAQKKTGEELVHVLIATTPSPWSGFLVLVPKKDIKFLDISIEDGIRLIISGGILKP
ncbi:MAG: DUF502 domain-containing protein [Candidatus Omnitrophota bacterium]|nr:DUF502 domain-containing protein [Candidatus Omnitrophota bacterium]